MTPGTPRPSLFEQCHGFFNVPQIIRNKCCETGPKVYRPYPRRLESLTICRCHYKGSTFLLNYFSQLFFSLIIVSTHGFKNELCYMLKRASLDLGLKNELCYRCSVLVLALGTTRLPEIPSESMCFQWIRWTPSDDFPTLLKVLFTLPVSSYD